MTRGQLLIMSYEFCLPVLLRQRSDIVNGKYEPTDDECVWENGDEDDEEGQGTTAGSV